ncbi:MAG: rRNA pseudouridine synthase [Alphaproteobacteria bacterium]|nr:rRNA pseudouridine synthase [Alphaproteobacteria bacterium]
MTDDTIKGERIAKVIARAGICSRREAERLINDGKVKVDRKTITSPALNVTAKNVIAVNGKIIPARDSSRIWRYYKPAGIVTTHKDPEGRPTVFEQLPANFPRVISVGRLDISSEGLLLLTNDGELARHMELPSTGWTRRYRARVHGVVDEKRLADLAKGITVDGVRYGSIQAVVEKKQRSNTWLSISIKEGKNREIRKVMEHLGLQVTRLIRTAYGPFQLGSLPKGKTEEVPTKVIKDQLGASSKSNR